MKQRGTDFSPVTVSDLVDKIEEQYVRAELFSYLTSYHKRRVAEVPETLHQAERSLQDRLADEERAGSELPFEHNATARALSAATHRKLEELARVSVFLYDIGSFHPAPQQGLSDLLSLTAAGVTNYPSPDVAARQLSELRANMEEQVRDSLIRNNIELIDPASVQR